MFDMIRRLFGLQKKRPESAEEVSSKEKSSILIRLQEQCARTTVDDKTKTTKVPGHPD